MIEFLLPLVLFLSGALYPISLESKPDELEVMANNGPLLKFAHNEQMQEVHGVQNRSVEDASVRATTQLVPGVEFEKRFNVDRDELAGEVFDLYHQVNEPDFLELFRYLFNLEFVINANSFVLDGKVSNDKLFQRYHGRNVFSVDLNEIRAALEQYNLYSMVKVRRVLPCSIVIETTKREPIALFYYDGKRYLIDRYGVLISEDYRDIEYFLPKVKLEVFGQGANIHLSALLDQFQKFPDLAEKVRMVRRVGNRRWDVCFVQEIVVKMPEEHAEFLERLEYLDALYKQNKLFDSGYSILDFRDSKCYASKKR
ncbi:cell division protein FtsQ/DivIB [Candidatus Sarmatiella mevalonica]|uniref:cell division protein FtsQ/DivIB n=1 Tax=Candidatus Sarmatiella mevalonica TaxID=2770581 RepID=UPI00192226AC|nr:cell division protein FtsQ/DivIB [Candidatus Sarmatiella mevalonica]